MTGKAESRSNDWPDRHTSRPRTARLRQGPSGQGAGRCGCKHPGGNAIDRPERQDVGDSVGHIPREAGGAVLAAGNMEMRLHAFSRASSSICGRAGWHRTIPVGLSVVATEQAADGGPHHVHSGVRGSPWSGVVRPHRPQPMENK